MALTAAQKATLNTMCPGAEIAVLGTAIESLETFQASSKEGKVTVSAAQQTAGKAIIAAGFTIGGYFAQVYRANVLLSLVKVSAATTNLTVETNSTDYIMTTGDVIMYRVFV